MVTHLNYILTKLHNTGYSVVIADDDADDQFLIQKALKEVNEQCSFIPVTNGLQLMDMLLKEGNYKDQTVIKPDIILLDINMPKLDGFSALERVRSNANLRHIPTYMLSTSRSEQDKHKSVLLGATAFYSKPNQFAMLKAIMVEVFESARLILQKSIA